MLVCCDDDDDDDGSLGDPLMRRMSPIAPCDMMSIVFGRSLGSSTVAVVAMVIARLGCRLVPGTI